MKKKKILFLIHTLGIGGAEKVLVNLANHMSNKYDITLMTVVDTGDFRNYLLDDITYKTIFGFKKRNKVRKNKKNQSSGSLLNNKKSLFKSILIKVYLFIWKHMPIKILCRLFIKDTYDVEISFLEGICAKIISGSKNPDSKKIAWIHVDLIEEKKSENVFKTRNEEQRCYDSFDKIVCVSEFVKTQFLNKFNINESKVLVKYNPIDAKEIIKKSKMNSNIKLSNKGLKIMSIGRLSYQKGYDRLLNVVKKLDKENYDFKIYIAGVGPLANQFNSFVTENKLDNRIEFLGFQKNPYNILIQSDLFICSSRAEGFSTAASEASILGIPTITTDCSGMSEMFGNNKYGYIVENSEKGLYEGLKYLLENQEILQDYRNGLKVMATRFDLDVLVNKVVELINE